MDTEEMYRRGVADAERDDLNTFYYQHYYPYRRGYDEMRRRLRRPGVTLRRRFPIMWLAVIVIATVGIWYAFNRESWHHHQHRQPWLPNFRPELHCQPARRSFPTKIPLPPSPTPTVTAKLQVGNQALVVTGGLRARRDPKLASPIVASFHEGDRVKIIEGPHEADGYTWWRVESTAGRGWSAQRSLEGVDWLRPSES